MFYTLVMPFLIVGFFFHCGYSSRILSQICHVFRHLKKIINDATVQLHCFCKRTGLISTHQCKACFGVWPLDVKMEEWFINLPQTHYVPNVLHWEKCKSCVIMSLESVKPFCLCQVISFFSFPPLPLIDFISPHYHAQITDCVCVQTLSVAQLSMWVSMF